MSVDAADDRAIAGHVPDDYAAHNRAVNVCRVTDFAAIQDFCAAVESCASGDASYSEYSWFRRRIHVSKTRVEIE